MIDVCDECGGPLSHRDIIHYNMWATQRCGRCYLAHKADQRARLGRA